jgi:penicillin-binding protein 1A
MTARNRKTSKTPTARNRLKTPTERGRKKTPTERKEGKRRRGVGSAGSKTRRKKRPLWQRIVLWCVLLGLLAGVTGAGVLIGLFYYYGADPELPNIQTVRDYKPNTVTRILDRKGKLIGEISVERRTTVPFNRMPKLLVRAVLAAEDADFFKHRGLDYMGMLRAFFANLRAGRFKQGGSTITQQVVKTFFLTPRRTIKRKMQEVILARRLESELTKEEILYLYLNQIYLGHGRYGVQEASRFYFGKDVDKLEVSQMALLAGLPQSPERLSPFKHPERAKRRQIYVLEQMVKQRFIEAAAAKQAMDAPIRVVRNTRPYYNAAPEFTDQVRSELIRAFGEKRLATLGLRVQTTLDVELQLAAREAVQHGLRALDARQRYRRPVRRLKGKRLKRQLARLKRRHGKVKHRPGPEGTLVFPTGKRYQAVVTGVDDKSEELAVDLGVGKGRVVLESKGRYNPQSHAPSKRFRAGDLIWITAEDDHFRFEGGPQAAMVAMDPRTGEVRAMVGGYEFTPGSFNRAVDAKRQPGSAFKPFLYAAALDSGRYTAATIVDDTPVVIGEWEPRNFDGTHRGPVRLRVALAHSINTVAARLIDSIKVEPVRKLATELGIQTPLGEDLSIALGTSEVRPVDLATAYCGIANGGKRLEPRYILRIGKEQTRAPAPRQVLRPEVAFVLTSMMQSVVGEGTARRARKLRRPVAGKTGTTNKQRDAWFAGFTPQLVAVVWVGFDDPRSLGRRETGGRAALPIWVSFMRKALKGQPKVPFRQPPGVVVQRIDPGTGLLAPEGATDVLEEYFISGTEPKQTAPAPDEVNPDTILMSPDVP